MSNRKLTSLRIFINKFFQSPIAVLGLASSVVLAFSIWYYPAAAALLYRYQGERSLQTVTRRTEEDQFALSPCDREPIHEPSERQALEQALIYFEKAVTYVSEDAGTYLKLGRVNCYLGNYQQAADAYRVYTGLRPKNPLGHLELALNIHALCLEQSRSRETGTGSNEISSSPDWEFCQDAELNKIILRELKASGVNSQEAFELGEYWYSAQQPKRFLVWYGWAIQLDPKNDMAWIKIGRHCQRLDLSVRPEICDLFWSHNSSNFIVDPGFVYPELFQVWDLYDFTDETDYGVENCPDVPDTLCASITVISPVPTDGAGLYQCVNILPGKTYEYNVWIKTELPANGHWRPLYYQGLVGNMTVGKWYTNQFFTGSQAWTYYELNFVAPAFDGGLACFHPIRLHSEGKVWFHSPQLKLVQATQ